MHNLGPQTPSGHNLCTFFNFSPVVTYPRALLSKTRRGSGRRQRFKIRHCLEHRPLNPCRAHPSYGSPAQQGLAGYLKAVWPDFWGVFEVWPAPGARESSQKCGVLRPPTFLKTFPGPRGRPDLKNAPQKSGQTAVKYPEGSDMEATCGDPEAGWGAQSGFCAGLSGLATTLRHLIGRRRIHIDLDLGRSVVYIGGSMAHPGLWYQSGLRPEARLIPQTRVYHRPAEVYHGLP